MDNNNKALLSDTTKERMGTVGKWVGGAAGAHLLTNIALRKYKGSKHFANSFAKHFSNVGPEKGFVGGLKEFGSGLLHGAVMPEGRAIRDEAYHLGQKTSQNLKNVPQQYRNDLVNLNIEKLVRQGGPQLDMVNDYLSKTYGAGFTKEMQQSLRLDPSKAKEVERVLKDPKYSLTSNLVPKMGTNVVEGARKSNPLYNVGYGLGYAASAFEPGLFAYNTVKNAIVFKKSPKILNEMFLTDPIQKSVELGQQGKQIWGKFNPAYRAYRDFAVNPLTSEPIHQAGELSRILGKPSTKTSSLDIATAYLNKIALANMEESFLRQEALVRDRLVKQPKATKALVGVGMTALAAPLLYKTFKKNSSLQALALLKVAAAEKLVTKLKNLHPGNPSRLNASIDYLAVNKPVADEQRKTLKKAIAFAGAAVPVGAAGLYIAH